VHHNDTAAHLSRSDSEGSNGTDDIMLENDKRMGMFGVCEENKILIRKGRQNLTCSVC